MTISEINASDMISIFDLNSKLVISQKANSTDVEIDVSGLGIGIYTIKVSDKNGSKIGKFIKQ